MDDTIKLSPEESKKTHLIYWGLVASIFLVIDILWNIYTPRSSLHDYMLFPWLRILILSFGLSIFILFFAVISIIIQRFISLPFLNERNKNIMAFIGFAIFIFLYISSWLSLHYTGLFLNLDIFRMLANDPVQLMQHVTHISPLALFISLTCTLVATWFLSIKLRHIAFQLQTTRYQQLRRVFISGATVLTLSSLTGIAYLASAGGKITDHQTGIGYTPMERFNETVSQRTGPVVSVVWEIKNSLTNLAFTSNGSGNNSLVQSRQSTSMSNYLNGASIKKKKNIIVLLVESLRSDQLPIYGGTQNIMPSLQDIASKSVVFTNAYATSSHSNYSDVAPLSSHYPLRSINVHYYPENPTYPRVLLHDILKPLGYKTAIISSQNEHWGNMLNYLDTGNLDFILHAENYNGVLRQSLANNSSPDDPLMGKRKQGKIDDKFTVTEAINWIDKQNKQPFMIYMNLQSSHFPYDISDSYLKDGNHDKVELPKFMGGNLGVIDRDAFKKAYQNSLRYIDIHINRLIQHLKQNDLLDDTILVISADTATAFFEHGQWGNGGPLYDEVVKVPLFIYNKDQQHKIDHTLTSHVDVMPTVLDMIGLPAHPSFQGVSTLSTTKEQREKRPIFLVCQSPAGYQYAVVKNNWKLIFDGSNGRKTLYKLNGDNAEKKDYSQQEPATNNNMTDLLFTWMNSQIDYYQQIQRHKTEYPPVINAVK